MLWKSKPAAEHEDRGGQSHHYADIVRPEKLGDWAIEKNPALKYFHEALQDWGERLGNPSRRPVCMTCSHEFRANSNMPSAWMFVRLSVNEAGVLKHMLVVGICESCATKNDTGLLSKGLAELRRAFPDMPEFKLQLVQEWSDLLN
jgi:hypothetical protein